MAADLDDWIDEAVEVEFVASRFKFLRRRRNLGFTLEGADERAILLGYIDESDPMDLKMIFCPWHTIERIHLLTTPWEPEPNE